MRSEAQIVALCDSYKKQLLLAIEEKTGSHIADPTLDMLILSLIDKLEALEWVLGQSNDDSLPYIYGNNISH